ncbi:MAG: L-aspartate dehydrogenase [Enterovirga sp.]|jgi:aspartate dehydrogenase|nr:L-aspartate dehydrogenase [Enterovirga sp.]
MASTKVGIAGLGAIGRALATRIAAGEVPGLVLGAVASGRSDAARTWLADQAIDCPVIQLREFPAHVDLVVECAPAAVLPEICRPMLEEGRRAMVLSCGALLRHPDLIELARDRGGQIIVPTGALLGLDAVVAAAEGVIHSVRMKTRKPPNGLAGAPYLEMNGISVQGLSEPKLVFVGTAREAARGFPANVNVAAALSLAGIGPDRTTIEIWADPGVSRNCHSIEVDADSARFTMSIENIPSENPKTGRITALSVLAALRKLHAPLRVGT